MYRLCYDWQTGQFFVGNDTEIAINLKLLKEKLKTHGSFTLNEYCDALSIPREDPFEGCVYTRYDFQRSSIFDMFQRTFFGYKIMMIGIIFIDEDYRTLHDKQFSHWNHTP